MYTGVGVGGGGVANQNWTSLNGWVSLGCPVMWVAQAGWTGMDSWVT